MERTGIDNLIAYWNTSLDGVQLRPSVFYAMVEEEIRSRQITQVQTTRVFWREHGWLSARREYLRVKCREFIFDICGFPTGPDFGVSWWLGVQERNIKNLIFEIPVLGVFLEERLLPVTYFEVDSNAAMQRAIHNSILCIVDGLTEQNELPRLIGLAREPVMAEFYD